jgi:hypothetical protein
MIASEIPYQASFEPQLAVITARTSVLSLAAAAGELRCWICDSTLPLLMLPLPFIALQSTAAVAAQATTQVIRDIAASFRNTMDKSCHVMQRMSCPLTKHMHGAIIPIALLGYMRHFEAKASAAQQADSLTMKPWIQARASMTQRDAAQSHGMAHPRTGANFAAMPRAAVPLLLLLRQES